MIPQHKGIGFKKDGTAAKPKKDGSARIAAGGYDEKKQMEWCAGVLDRAEALAREMFGNATDIVLARYAALDSGYEGCRRLYQKRIGLPRLRLLCSECAQRLALSGVFKAKYINFLHGIEASNMAKVAQSVAAKKRAESLTNING